VCGFLVNGERETKKKFNITHGTEHGKIKQKIKEDANKQEKQNFQFLLLLLVVFLFFWLLFYFQQGKIENCNFSFFPLLLLPFAFYLIFLSTGGECRYCIRVQRCGRHQEHQHFARTFIYFFLLLF
jgi:hypothetical protein